MSEEFDAALEGMGSDRRAFLKRVAIGSAFAVPVVASFSMSGVQAVYAQSTTASGAVSAGGATAATTTTLAANTTTTSTSTTTTTTANSNTTWPEPIPVPSPSP